MPSTWFDRYHAGKLADEPMENGVSQRDFYLSIVADKKPYFMRYIYPKVLRQYNAYIKNTNVRCFREFRMDVNALMQIPPEERTERQEAFLKYFNDRLPVSNNDCTMNRICRRFEQEFDGRAKMRGITGRFDPSIMKSGVGYSQRMYSAVSKMYDQYNRKIRDYATNAYYTRDATPYEVAEARKLMLLDFKAECEAVCPNADELCDIVIDLCYSRETSKQFAWDLCGKTIVRNLLARNGGSFSYPILDPDGDIEFAGETFSMLRKESEVWLKSF